MSWTADLYSIILVIGALTAAPLGFLIWHRRRAVGSAAAAVALLGCTTWTLGYLGELHTTNIQLAELFAKIESGGLAVIPEAWLVFILQYAGLDRWLTRRTLTALMLIPVAVIVMLITNDATHLMWSTAEIIQVGSFHRLVTDYGPGFWTFVALAYAQLGLATWLTLQLMARTHAAYRLQVLATVVAALVPWAASLHDLIHFEPFPYLDLTPLAFTFTCAMLALNLLRWRMADVVPVARGAILESMEDALIVVDSAQRVVDVNIVTSRMVGRESNNLVGEPLPRAWPRLAQYIENPTQNSSNLGYFVHVNGAQYDVRVSPLRDQGQRLVGHIYVLRDVTSQVEIEDALRKSETRYALAAQGANDGLWDWDLANSELYFSPRARALLGLADDTPVDGLDHAFPNVHPDDLPLLRAEIDAHLDGQTPTLSREFRVLQTTGGQRWCLLRGLAVGQETGSPQRVAGSLTDITDHKAAEGQLRFAALHDNLTGLPNRSLLMDRLDHALQRTRRDPSKFFAVLFLDLDRFKTINDSLGHLVGDLLLKEVARRLGTTLREVDTVARLGGDEFVVILEGIENVNGAQTAAERIQTALSEVFLIENHEVFTSASIGIALGSRPHIRPEEILRDADLALYQAKSMGGGRYALFDQHMHQRAVTQFELEVDLRRALDIGGLLLHYQPIRSLASRHIVGFEALVRWEHPSRGLLHPADFLAIADSTGLIIPIGYWVLDTAVDQLRVWQNRFPGFKNLSMSINLSARQLAEDDVVERVREVLDSTGVDPADLHLEITENVMIEDGVLAAHRLSQLRGLGVHVHIDDFGTGYSSLSVLHNFPVDSLKVERSFVSRIDHGGRDAQIVQTVISLAHALQLDVIAEGIETEDQLIRLMGLGCTLGQGFLLGAPQPPEAVEALLTSSIPPRERQLAGEI